MEYILLLLYTIIIIIIVIMIIKYIYTHTLYIYTYYYNIYIYIIHIIYGNRTNLRQSACYASHGRRASYQPSFHKNVIFQPKGKAMVIRCSLGVTRRMFSGNDMGNGPVGNSITAIQPWQHGRSSAPGREWRSDRFSKEFVWIIGEDHNILWFIIIVP